MAKMAVIPIYGKKKIINKNKLLCSVTILVDCRVSDRCPWATCLCLPNWDKINRQSSSYIKRMNSIKQSAQLFPKGKVETYVLVVMTINQGSVSI